MGCSRAVVYGGGCEQEESREGEKSGRVVGECGGGNGVMIDRWATATTTQQSPRPASGSSMQRQEGASPPTSQASRTSDDGKRAALVDERAVEAAARQTVGLRLRSALACLAHAQFPQAATTLAGTPGGPPASCLLAASALFTSTRWKQCLSIASLPSVHDTLCQSSPLVRDAVLQHVGFLLLDSMGATLSISHRMLVWLFLRL